MTLELTHIGPTHPSLGDRFTFPHNPTSPFADPASVPLMDEDDFDEDDFSWEDDDDEDLDDDDEFADTDDIEEFGDDDENSLDDDEDEDEL